MNRSEILSLVSENFSYLTTYGFQIDEIDVSPDGKLWVVVFEGKYQIRIMWNWRDGFYIMASKSKTNDRHEGYDVKFLVYTLSGKEKGDKFFDETKEFSGDIKSYSQFLLEYLDRLTEFVTSIEYEQSDENLKQAKKEYFNSYLLWLRKCY